MAEAPGSSRIDSERSSLWRAPVPIGVPGSVLQQAPALAGAYRNSGKMTAGLAELKSAASRTVEVSTHSVKAVEMLHAELKSGLEQLEANLEQEMAQAQRRVSDEMQRAQAHIHQSILGDVRNMVQRLASTKDVGNQAIHDATVALARCTDRLQEDLQQSEANFMESLAQLVVYNSWTTAW
ncbi:hypothetical protein OC835_004564 [Tilletia horrida]|nr:hypothetical protein OC835_004564 [Tilletia horrida]KAK0563956.1 hypothetical protein OC844_001952 [Tilletia horrida]